MNKQTPGPLRDGLANRQGVTLSAATARGWHDVAHLPRDSEEDQRPEADARLLASAYTAFDAAGRSLGIDAATLAESVDVAALIRAARLVESGWRVSQRTKATPGELAILDALATFPGETGAI